MLLALGFYNTYPNLTHMPNFARLVAAFVCSAVLVAPSARPQSDVSNHLPEAERSLAHNIFRQLIEINTTDSVGSVTKAAEAMRQHLLAGGFSADDISLVGPDTPAENKGRKDNLVVRYRGRPNSTLKPVLFIGHLDVVEARPSDWTTDPFHLVEQDGYFYGRGTQDMKDSDAALVDAFLRLRREGFTPDRDLILALTADEEGGKSNGVDFLLQHHRNLVDAAFAINPDSGGVELEHGTAVAVGLEATEKLYADYRVTITNPGGHSSLPRPDNAIYQLANALVRLEQTPFPLETNPITRAYFAKEAERKSGQVASDMRAVSGATPDPAAAARLSADPTYNSTLHTTCVATMLSAGHAPNALPGSATANINCRILPGHSQEEIRQRLLQILTEVPLQNSALSLQYIDDAGVAYPQGSNRRSMMPETISSEVLQPLEATVHQLWPNIPVIPLMEPGASDSVYTSAAGIPSYGFSGMGVDRDDIRAHGRNERIRVVDFDNGVQFEYLFIKQLTSR